VCENGTECSGSKTFKRMRISGQRYQRAILPGPPTLAFSRWQFRCLTTEKRIHQETVAYRFAATVCRTAHDQRGPTQNG
jgi:hypothetical protein